jgi:hypothetical protein
MRSTYLRIPMSHWSNYSPHEDLDGFPIEETCDHESLTINAAGEIECASGCGQQWRNFVAPPVAKAPFVSKSSYDAYKRVRTKRRESLFNLDAVAEQNRIRFVTEPPTQDGEKEDGAL